MNCISDLDDDGYVGLSDVLITQAAYDAGCP